MTAKTVAKAPHTTRLSATEILAIDDRETEDVYVPQWDTLVMLRSMTGAERDRYEAGLTSYERMPNGSLRIRQVELDNLRARTIALVALNGDGGQLFTSQQIMALGAKNAAALDVLFDAARRLSKLTEPAIEAAKEALGNAPSDEHGSDSPGSSE
jgi:hypothetical protein